jgi:hypothetical protein
VQGSEWRRVAIFAVVLVFLTLIPYLVGFMRAGDDWLFNGFTFGVDDGNAYLGKMRIGAQGNWRFSLFYTSEAHDDAFGLYLPHIIVGHLLRLVTTPDVNALAVTFQIWRVLASLILIAATYRFIAEFVRGQGSRWLAMILATLGGGLGWLLVIVGQPEAFGSLPLEFIVPEDFSFLVIYGLPHIAMARAALLLGLLVVQKNDWRYVLAAGLLWNIVGLMVTFYLAVLYVILAAWGSALWLRRRSFPKKFTLLAGTAAALTLPLFFYNVWLFRENEAFAQWSRQNELPSPHGIHYVLGFGLLVFLAIPGFRWAWNRASRPGNDGYALLVGWVAIVPVLVYLPINVQRRLAEAVIVPLAILATVGLKLWAAHLRNSIGMGKSVRRLVRVVLILSLPSTLLFWLITLFGMLSPGCTADVCLFRASDELAALDWLSENADSDAVVMGGFRTGNFLPIRTDLSPFLGHGPETLYSDDKENQVEAFYAGGLTMSRRDQLLDEYGIDYVIFGPLERELGADASAWNAGLARVYSHAGYDIYEITSP